MAERKRILLEHIYGVDIDPQAVEVTKLSLLLKVLEGESQEVGRQAAQPVPRAGPARPGAEHQVRQLADRAGFLRGGQASFLEAEEQYRINAFDWQTRVREVFAEAGGFDAVIGNPPYRRIFQ